MVILVILVLNLNKLETFNRFQAVLCPAHSGTPLSSQGTCLRGKQAAFLPPSEGHVNRIVAAEYSPEPPPAHSCVLGVHTHSIPHPVSACPRNWASVCLSRLQQLLIRRPLLRPAGSPRKPSCRSEGILVSTEIQNVFQLCYLIFQAIPSHHP